MAILLKGAPVAAALSEQLAERVSRLNCGGTYPVLAIVRVGQRPDDMAYERGATKRCKQVGVAVQNFVLPTDCTQETLLAVICRINETPEIHGCLLFRPLPKQLDERVICETLIPQKDVDGMTAGSMAGVFSGNGMGFPPCTAQACVEILKHYGYNPAGKRVTVIGRSLVIGKPVALLLLNQDATVTVCHTKTVNLPAQCRGAEILIAAAGRAGMVNTAFAGPEQIVIDVGIHVTENGLLCGDVMTEPVAALVKAITPVPGGVGTVTSTILALHTIEAAEKGNI